MKNILVSFFRAHCSCRDCNISVVAGQNVAQERLKYR